MKNFKLLGAIGLLLLLGSVPAHAYTPLTVDDVSSVWDTDTGTVVGVVPPGQANVTKLPNWAGGGTFVAIGTTGVAVANTAYKTSQSVIITLNTVGGTVGAMPTIQIGTSGTGFNVKATALDTSTYNYLLMNAPPH